MKEPDLRAFAKWAIAQSMDGCDADGGDIQEKAAALGLLTEVEVSEPCGEGCVCAEVAGDDSFPLNCYRLHPSLIDEPPAGREVVDG